MVDEEHEAAYKQEDGVSYHARDMAVVRAQIEKSAVVLASATPSIESRVNAEQGRYGWLKLAARHGDRPMPDLTAIDLTLAPDLHEGDWLTLDYDLRRAAVESGLSQYELLTVLHRRFARK